MRRFLLNMPALIALALLCALATPTVNAQDSPYSWESLDVFIDVQQNGDIVVEETSAYAFQRQHDFFRSDTSTWNSSTTSTKCPSPWTAGTCPS